MSGVAIGVTDNGPPLTLVVTLSILVQDVAISVTVTVNNVGTTRVLVVGL